MSCLLHGEERFFLRGTSLEITHGHLIRHEKILFTVSEEDGQRAGLHRFNGGGFCETKATEDARKDFGDISTGEDGEDFCRFYHGANDLPRRRVAAISNNGVHVFRKPRANGHEDGGGAHGDTVHDDGKVLSVCIADPLRPALAVIALFVTKGDVATAAFAEGALIGRDDVESPFAVKAENEAEIMLRRGEKAMHEKDGGTGVFRFQHLCVKGHAVIGSDGDIPRSEGFKPSGLCPTLFAVGCEKIVIIEGCRIDSGSFRRIFLRRAMKRAEKDHRYGGDGQGKEKSNNAENGV